MLLPEQIKKDIQDLPEEAQSLLIDFVRILKKRYAKATLQTSTKSLYEKFDESGLIGFVEDEEDLSISYKQILAESLTQKL
ncbi:MAG: DUF2281 domain-containing protein [Cyanobacteriota bacterium]|nr:DUF2281 domain-containing protein [Cyanobacteriota bacterium]